MVEIVDFLNNVTTKNYVEAEKNFSDLINDRLATRIESEKQAVAAAVFNSELNNDEDEVEEGENELEASTEEQPEDETVEEE